jgi:hypothetical protein
VLAEQLAVVRHQNHQGVPQLVVGHQLAPNRLDGVVHRAQRPQLCLPLQRAG